VKRKDKSRGAKETKGHRLTKEEKIVKRAQDRNWGRKNPRVAARKGSRGQSPKRADNRKGQKRNRGSSRKRGERHERERDRNYVSGTMHIPENERGGKNST